MILPVYKLIQDSFDDKIRINVFDAKNEGSRYEIGYADMTLADLKSGMRKWELKDSKKG